MKTILIGMLLAVSVCASFANAKDFTEAQKSKLKETVKQKLLDADSARFTLPAYKGGNIYCGLVNSKNTYGGYAGNAIFQVFVVSPTYFNFMGLGTADPDSARSLTMSQSCAEKGYKF